MQAFLYIISILGTIVIIYFSLKGKSEFLFYLLLIKPFIDLAVEVRFGGVNAITAIGTYLFIYLFFFSGKIFTNKIFVNYGKLMLFIGLNLLSLFYGFFFKRTPTVALLDLTVLLIDAYGIYFLASYLMRDPGYRLRIYKMIWYSLLFLGCLYIFTVIFGLSQFDQGKVGQYSRFTGLYNDPGTPAYQAVIALIFGTLYLNLLKKHNMVYGTFVNYLYYLSWVTALIIMWITLTKSAFVMFFIFMIMHFGKRSVISLGLILVLSGTLLTIVYQSSPTLQARFSKETAFLEKQTLQTAHGIGAGRVSRWNRIFDTIKNEFSFYELIFGNAKTYGAHNNYIAFLTSVGILGLSVFMAILYSFCRQLWRLYKKYKSDEYFYALVFLLAIMAYAITGHPFYYSTIQWYLMVLLAVVNIKVVPVILHPKTLYKAGIK
jgi:hypothetical protein